MVKKMLVTPRAAQTVKTEDTIRVSAHDIRDRAYELFQERGRGHGHDVEDWLVAEGELLQSRNAEVVPPSPDIQRRLG